MGRFDEKYKFASDEAVPKLEAIRAALDESGAAEQISRQQRFVLGLPAGSPQVVEKEIESYWLGDHSVCISHLVGKSEMLVELSGPIELFEKLDRALTAMGGKGEHGLDYWRNQNAAIATGKVLSGVRIILFVAAVLGGWVLIGIYFGWIGAALTGGVLALLAFLYVVMLAKSFRR